MGSNSVKWCGCLGEERVSCLKSPAEMDRTWATPTVRANDRSNSHQVTNLISLSISVASHLDLF